MAFLRGGLEALK
jgi:hypothetical protein